MEKVIAQLKSQIDLENTSQRERIILVAGVILVVGVVLFQFVISPYLASRERLEQSVVRNREALQEMEQLSKEYGALRIEEGGMRELLKKRQSNFTLFAFLDQQAASAGIKARIKYMKPSFVEGENGLNESVVEMRLEGVNLKQLTEFLKHTESEENVVSIRRLSVQTSSREEGFLDVVLQIVTLEEARE